VQKSCYIPYWPRRASHSITLPPLSPPSRCYDKTCSSPTNSVVMSYFRVFRCLSVSTKTGRNNSYLRQPDVSRHFPRPHEIDLHHLPWSAKDPQLNNVQLSPYGPFLGVSTRILVSGTKYQLAKPDSLAPCMTLFVANQPFSNLTADAQIVPSYSLRQ
jgi:hypothetical protein